MPSEWHSERAPRTASGEQHACVPSVRSSAQSLRVTATTSAPRSRSTSAATAESTPPLTATRTRSPAGSSRDRLAGGGERAERARERVGNEIGRVAALRAEAADQRRRRRPPRPGRRPAPARLRPPRTPPRRTREEPRSPRRRTSPRRSRRRRARSEIRTRSPQTEPPALPGVRAVGRGPAARLVARVFAQELRVAGHGRNGSPLRRRERRGDGAISG